jgi:hypothetical protein
MYRKLKNLNSQRINDPVKKWARELNRNFSMEEVQMGKKHIKKFSASQQGRQTHVRAQLFNRSYHSYFLKFRGKTNKKATL